MAETQAASALSTVAMEGSDLASLLQKELKPKSEEARGAVEQAVQTLARAGAVADAADRQRRRGNRSKR